jgi:hypothetical protein
MPTSKAASTTPVAVPGAKIMYLIRRKPATSREELVAHWFANHMPIVIASQHKYAAQQRPHAKRYLATLFQPAHDGTQPWDGVAQLWWDRAFPKPATPFGTTPTDTFQQKAEPYMPWPTTEYVIVDGSERLSSAPLTLNAPYPSTRSGFCKITYLVKAKSGVNFDELFAHWLGVHTPNVARIVNDVGGFRYVVSHSIDPATEPYAGMAEIYFPNDDAWRRFGERLTSDGIEGFLDLTQMLVLRSDTEMIGIP